MCHYLTILKNSELMNQHLFFKVIRDKVVANYPRYNAIPDLELKQPLRIYPKKVIIYIQGLLNVNFIQSIWSQWTKCRKEQSLQIFPIVFSIIFSM